MANDERRTWSYLATDPTSPEYAWARATAFGVASVVVVVLGLIRDIGPVVGVGVLFGLGAIWWAQRARRARRHEEQVPLP